MIDQSAFEQRLNALASFEAGTHLAVAVSGGSDSMALALLARVWAVRQSCRLTALTVDHGLREASRQEALRVGRWLKGRGVSHRVLTWEGDKPASGRMAAAREARYRLMEDWCAKHKVRHLLLAHQLEDQAETFLMRLARGSGADGLSGMAPVHARQTVRLLRPLLDVSRADLRAYLESLGQDWIEDPSNDNLAFERVRIRQALPLLAELGLNPQALAASAAKLQKVRAYLDEETARALARHVTWSDAGFAWVERAVLDEPGEIARRLLARLLTSVGGALYPPPDAQLEGLLAALVLPNWRGSTLAGCRLAPRQGRILIAREAAACAGPVRLVAGQGGLWDGRFRFVAARSRGLYLGALGAAWAAQLAASHPELKNLNVPALVWPSLPAIRDARGVFQVPGLGYKRSARALESLADLSFAPRRGHREANPHLS